MAFIIDGTTGIATVDGSVSAPSQRGQDTNSGISYASDTIRFSTNGVERLAISNSGLSGDGSGLTGVSGKFIQIKSDVKPDTASFQVGGGSTALLSSYGLYVQITPTSATNRILVFGQVCIHRENDGLMAVQITKDGSGLSGAIGDTSGNRQRVTSGGFADTSTVLETVPFSAVVAAGSTSQQEYSIKIMHDSGSERTMYVNRGREDTPDNQYRYRGISAMTVMEIEP